MFHDSVCYPQLSECQRQCPQCCKAFDLDPLRQTKPRHIRVELPEFSKSEHAQKTPVRIANEGQLTGAVRISTT